MYSFTNLHSAQKHNNVSLEDEGPFIYASLILFLFYCVWLYQSFAEKNIVRTQQNIKPSSGGSALHAMINASANFNEMRTFLNTTDQKKLSRMTRTIDDNGKLPLDLLAKKTSWPRKDKNKLKRILVKLIFAHRVKPLSQPMTIDKTVQRYQVATNSPLYKNLSIGCEVGNKTRKKFQGSTTHAEANFYTTNQLKSIDKKIYDMREADRFTQLKLSDFSLRDQTTLFTCLRARNASLAGVGNCDEFASESVRSLEEEYQIKAWVEKIARGDHLLAVFGDGEAKVMLDAHHGKIFPYRHYEREIKCFHPRKLNQQDYQNYSGVQQSVLNIYTFFNPRYHSRPQLREASKHFSRDLLNAKKRLYPTK
jgi:hypothetical protein